jgi:PEP-CTERM motif
MQPKKWALAIALATTGVTALAGVKNVNEGFNSVLSLSSAGWLLINNSTAPTTTNWYQGDTDAATFSAHAGAANSFISANFLNAAPGGAISNWLVTPEIDLEFGAASLSFAVRGNPSGAGPEAVAVYFSNSGSAVGTTTTSTGDFTLLKQYDFNTAPNGWLTDSLTVNGVSGNGRFAFRYIVADTNVGGDTIGIDSVVISSVPEPTTLMLGSLGLLATLGATRRRVKK